MFTGNEDMEATALRKRGWSISAIARHLGRSRETVRNHLNGTRSAGERKRSTPDPFDEYVPYLRARFEEDPHVWATCLYDEVTALGYSGSYPTFTRGLRLKQLRPHCEACDGVNGRQTIDIPHPPSAEIQWDWDELPGAPWADGGDAHLLVGTLSCSGKARGMFCESEDQAHLIAAIDGVLRRLGGTSREWRFDRMATVIDPKTGTVQPSFVAVAKYYNVTVVACPPRRGNRKGVVEKGVHFSSERFWRTMTARTMVEAQRAYDRFCETIGDARPRPLARLAELLGSEEQATESLAARGRRRPTVADLAACEPLSALPTVAYPATIAVVRRVDRQCLVDFEANHYGVPTGLVGAEVTVRRRLGADEVEIASAAGVVIATHRRRTPGAGYVVRDPAQRAALESEVLAAFTSDPPCRRKANRPPGEKARAEARKLSAGREDTPVIVSLQAYQAVVDDMTAKGRGAGS